MAPTPGHITFLLWAVAATLLHHVGIASSLYMQYLWFTYVFSAWFAFTVFALFAWQLFRCRYIVAFVSTGFAFSGIGLWLGAWLYFQETITLFLQLGAWNAVMARPSRKHAMWLVAALMIQVASVNYWTVHHSWFLILYVGSYVCFYPYRFRCALRMVRTFALCRPFIVITLGVGVLFTICLWSMLYYSTIRAEADKHIRGSSVHQQSIFKDQKYTKQAARDRIQVLRWSTVEFFNPNLARAMEHYHIINPIHYARYIGVCCVPLLAILCCMNWTRRERFLVTTCAGVLAITLGPPWIIALWDVFPGTNRIMHLLYFYTWFLQFLLLLLAGCTLDRLVTASLEQLSLSHTRRVLIGLLLLCGLIFMAANLLASQFPSHHTGYESALQIALYLGVTCLLLYRFLLQNKPQYWLISLVIFFQIVDLTRYFYIGSMADHRFSLSWRQLPAPLPADLKLRLATPAGSFVAEHGYELGIPAMLPISVELWPTYMYLYPSIYSEIMAAHLKIQPHPMQFLSGTIHMRDPIPAHFFTSYEVASTETQLYNYIQDHAGFFRRLWFTPDIPAMIDPIPKSVDPMPPFELTGFQGNYNEMRFQVTVPTSGWLLLHQAYHPYWKYYVNGRHVLGHRANLIRTAIPIPQGVNTFQMRFRPPARSYYLPAVVLLFITLSMCLIIALYPYKDKQHDSSSSSSSDS